VKRLTGVSAALVLALVLTATAGSALAENPHNPGTSPGNSGNVPGQEKKDQATATATTAAATPAAQPAQAGPGKSDNAPGQEKKSAAPTPTTQSASAKASHTAADGSKQYGNGKSALQIAKQTKSSITIDDLSEPGNSGKHKVTICHNGHLITVDVHALQAHARHLDGSDVIPATSAAQCSTAQSGSTQTHGHNSAVVSSIVTIFGSSGNGSGTTGGTNGSSASGTSGGSGAGAGEAGGVEGISATLGSGQPRGGVLGIAATRVKGALPFTGFALWIAVLVGAGLLIGGTALVSRSRGLNSAT